MQRQLYIDELHMALDIFCFAAFFWVVYTPFTLVSKCQIFLDPLPPVSNCQILTHPLWQKSTSYVSAMKQF